MTQHREAVLDLVFDAWAATYIDKSLPETIEEAVVTGCKLIDDADIARMRKHSPCLDVLSNAEITAVIDEIFNGAQ